MHSQLHEKILRLVLCFANFYFCSDIVFCLLQYFVLIALEWNEIKVVFSSNKRMCTTEDYDGVKINLKDSNIHLL